ncbi:hypothetical protein JZ751_003357, partial [Albula glossodonta]
MPITHSYSREIEGEKEGGRRSHDFVQPIKKEVYPGLAVFFQNALIFFSICTPRFPSAHSLPLPPPSYPFPSFLCSLLTPSLSLPALLWTEFLGRVVWDGSLSCALWSVQASCRFWDKVTPPILYLMRPHPAFMLTADLQSPGVWPGGAGSGHSINNHQGDRVRESAELCGSEVRHSHSPSEPRLTEIVPALGYPLGHGREMWGGNYSTPRAAVKLLPAQRDSDCQSCFLFQSMMEKEAGLGVRVSSTRERGRERDRAGGAPLQRERESVCVCVSRAGGAPLQTERERQGWGSSTSERERE